jgi:hypothetical protein
MNASEKINLSIPRRQYYNNKYNLTICPECGSPTIEYGCTILLGAETETDGGELITNLSGSHFCESCPVVIFDKHQIAQAAQLGMRTSKKVKHGIIGIVDLDSIPKDKRHLEIGTDENPVPLVEFLPDLNKKPIPVSIKKTGRNEPCPCGSGKKYKNCCAT